MHRRSQPLFAVDRAGDSAVASAVAVRHDDPLWSSRLHLAPSASRLCKLCFDASSSSRAAFDGADGATRRARFERASRGRAPADALRELGLAPLFPSVTRALDEGEGDVTPRPGASPSARDDPAWDYFAHAASAHNLAVVAGRLRADAGGGGGGGGARLAHQLASLHSRLRDVGGDACERLRLAIEARFETVKRACEGAEGVEGAVLDEDTRRWLMRVGADAEDAAWRWPTEAAGANAKRVLAALADGGGG
ncbi:uncharacterized protein MICPUCDRAFT_56832 [Micromonas pusilla CCMP1545]|uniref:Predicted protein n=1 Tax=Micromonas pusilla (strain CCMP1545) TaxID=564608 RepID=C1MN95_MICPC|nr:uncharacterized protein MICPUCDRAFT_56832 [Micromonas pusilla CCMP1545]EEH58712.1 predicted protein [Micromonas pusilla CCMP1545]|eukprot:XP_003057067.1 predicted protein [Micromonas pusilla CCMP1545]